MLVSRWSLLLLAFPRQQKFRKTSSRSSACWERVILNSPWNTQVDDMRPQSQTTQILLRGTTIRLTPRNSYAPCGTKADSCLKQYLVVRQRRYVTRRRRYAHIILFSKVELFLHCFSKNSKMILQVIENLKVHTAHCACVTHTAHL